MLETWLKTFLCVCEYGSFTKAAELLFLSPTAIMKQMNQLEIYFDCTIFERSSKGVCLTPAGACLQRDAHELLTGIDQVRERMREAGEMPAWKIRIGYMFQPYAKLLASIVDGIGEEAQRYQIRVSALPEAANSTKKALKLLGKDYDFLLGPCDITERSGVARVILQRQKFCLAVPRYSVHAIKTVIQPSELNGCTLRMVEEGQNAAVDALRRDLKSAYPGISLLDNSNESDQEILNDCVEHGHMILATENQTELHPLMKLIPVDWNYYLSVGLMYKVPNSQKIEMFADKVKSLLYSFS